ncbi:MAG: heavy-metal-associated domain-containing protein [Nitrososphaerota archaeon]|nr:heavy-metal-associated domain-containing protein [Nitrososphaerota archaeon]
MSSSEHMRSRTVFTVKTIECVACTPSFKRELGKLRGVKSVRPLIMLNRIEVEFDDRVISKQEIRSKILEIGTKSGFGGKIVFHE